MRYIKSLNIYMQGFSCWFRISNSIHTFNYLALVQYQLILLFIMVHFKQYHLGVSWGLCCYQVKITRLLICSVDK